MVSRFIVGQSSILPALFSMFQWLTHRPRACTLPVGEHGEVPDSMHTFVILECSAPLIVEGIIQTVSPSFSISVRISGSAVVMDPVAAVPSPSQHPSVYGGTGRSASAQRSGAATRTLQLVSWCVPVAVVIL